MSTQLDGATKPGGATSRPAAAGPAPPAALPAVEPPVGALGRIRECLGALNGTSLRVAEFVLTRPWEVRGLSISDLANRAGVSVNSINRATRDLGYRGYREFSQALALDLGKILGGAYGLPAGMAAGLPDSGEPDSALGVVSRTLLLEVQALQETLHHLDGEAVQRTVDALSAARAVLFIGTGSALPACAMGAYRLAVLGIRATHSGDPSTMLAEVHLLDSQDVVFAVSHHGAPQHVVFTLGHARERGVTTVCLTAAAGSPAARAADIALLTLGRAAAGGPGQFASRVVSAALIEGLVAAVAWRKFGGTPPEVEDLLRAQGRLKVPPQPRSRRRASS